MLFLLLLLLLLLVGAAAGVDEDKENAVVQIVFDAARCTDECKVEKAMVCVDPPQCATQAQAVIAMRMANTRTDALPAGVFHSEIAHLSHLKLLEISRFNFSESRLPTELGLLTKLVSLSVVASALNASVVPSQLGQLGELFRLHLPDNGLQSSLPRQLGNISGLQDIDLTGNRLFGVVPAFPRLTMCKLSGNRCLVGVVCPLCCDGRDAAPPCEEPSLVPNASTTLSVASQAPLPVPIDNNNGNVFVDEIVVFVVGAVVFVAGLVFLIVVLVRRKKQAAAAAAAAAAASSTATTSKVDDYSAPPEVIRRESSRRRHKQQDAYTPVPDASQLRSSTPPPGVIKRVSSRRKRQEAQGTYTPVPDASQLRSSTPPPGIVKRVSSRRKRQEAQGAYVPVGGGAVSAPQRYTAVPEAQRIVAGSDGHTYVPAVPPPALTKRKTKSKRSLAASMGSGGGSSGSIASASSLALAGRGEAWRIDSKELQLGRELGRGAYGVVREATLHGRKVAVKTLKIDGLGGEKAQAEFENEVARMASLPPHDCVVQLLGVTAIDGDMAAVVEFCASGSLLDALYGKNVREFTRAQLLGFAHDAACGLAHLHRNLIVHRDIAARNVLLSGKSDLTAKIADFGMSRAGAQAGMMQTIQSVGPVAWMAPEMLSARQYAAASDVYAFGVLLYEIFARQKPWPGLKLMEVAERVLQRQQMEPPHDSAPAAVCALMVQCWAFEPDARPDITAVRKALEDLQEEE